MSKSSSFIEFPKKECTSFGTHRSIKHHSPPNLPCKADSWGWRGQVIELNTVIEHESRAYVSGDVCLLENWHSLPFSSQIDSDWAACRKLLKLPFATTPPVKWEGEKVCIGDFIWRHLSSKILSAEVRSVTNSAHILSTGRAITASLTGWVTRWYSSNSVHWEVAENCKSISDPSWVTPDTSYARACPLLYSLIERDFSIGSGLPSYWEEEILTEFNK